jgi:hypothetical protein
VRNRRRPELSERDADSALDRMALRSEERDGEARHVYDTLTWGEGPEQLTQPRVQDRLWYRLPTKYLTDEPGYMTRLAGIAAALFDQLALEGYAAICRSRATVEVHAAFDRSSEEGYAEMRRALEASGIEPPDTDSFSWGDVMRTEESLARSSAELALERAIDTGDLVVGGRGWRTCQRGSPMRRSRRRWELPHRSRCLLGVQRQPRADAAVRAARRGRRLVGAPLSADTRR